MDEQVREALQIALQEALQARSKADATIEFLTERLGVSPVLITGPNDGPVLGSDHRDVGPITITEGEFYGLTSSTAAVAVLERAGRSRPLKTDELFGYVIRGGVALTGKNARLTFGRTIRRDGRFQRVGPGRWGLREWYPGSAPRRSKSASPPLDGGEPFELEIDDEEEPTEEP